MIKGVGTDIIEVERVAEKIGKNSGFRELVYSPGEIQYCESKTNKYEHYAARFAAKEAFLKAAGVGWINELHLFEIEIVNDENGKPFFHFLGDTAIKLKAQSVHKVSVSLSHLKSIASAIVIIESDQTDK
jgi:holo-[acyl-carrier protein] synthase